jgi:hypothetical protein
MKRFLPSASQSPRPSLFLSAKGLGMKSLRLTPLALLLVFLLCRPTTNSTALDWQPTGISAPWSRIACSADATRVMAVGEYASLPCATGIFASTNSGVTWFAPSVDAGVDVAASADGTLWAVADAYCNDLLFSYSTSSGSLIRTQININSSLIALSSDGTRLIAGGLTYGIFGSTDSGVSWQSLLYNVAVSSLASSADGSTLVAASPSNAVYTSTNFGATWSTNIVDTQWPGPWNSVACSVDASRIFAGSDDGVFVSTNAGLAWTQIHAPDSFQSIAVSADASQIAAAVRAGLIYTSTNSGLNWDLSGLGDLSALGNTNDIITTVAMAADGSRMFAAPSGGNVYTTQSTALPVLKMVPAGKHLSFSWPFPSINFVLQQTTNPITNLWQDVPVSPIPNLTNLQILAAIPAPTQSVFFRLASYQPLQSGFVDLGFESGVIRQTGQDPYIFFQLAFPGWTAYTGTTRVSLAFFNNLLLNTAGIGLLTNSSGQFDGKYYAAIQSGLALTGKPPPILTSYLSQTGLIPPNAQSLQFKASGSGYVVSLNGQALSLSPLGVNLYGANVKRFKGTTAELRFTVLTNLPPQSPVNTVYLDSISFSTRTVP